MEQPSNVETIQESANENQQQTVVEEQKDETPTTLEGNELRETILSQVEYYFSQENLSSDHFLVSQMDAEKYVPLSIIANFGKMKALTADLELLIDVISSSKVIELDSANTKVKSKLLDHQRTTIILREIPADTTEEEINAIFTNFEDKVTSVRFDIGNTCFVTFPSEKAALSALNFVKLQQFRGKPIQARIKTETILRSCNSVKQHQNPHFVPYQYAPYPYAHGGAWNMSGKPSDSTDPDFRQNRENRNVNNSHKPNSNNNNGRGKQRKDGNNNNNSNNNNNTNSGNSYHSRKPNTSSTDKRGSRPPQRKKGGRDNRKNSPEFQLGGTHFPPLPSNREGANPNEKANSAAEQRSWSQVLSTKPNTSKSS